MPRKVVQINLQHARTASVVLSRRKVTEGLDIALIQEPWALKGKIMGLGSAGRILYHAGGTRPRAGIVLNKNINLMPLPDLITDDLVAAYVNVGDGSRGRLVVASAYLPGDDPNPERTLRPLVEFCRDRKTKLLLGCDANVHHVAWGSTDINKRGELLFDYLINNELLTLNEGNQPTFVTINRREVLDVTVWTDNVSPLIVRWHVSDEPSVGPPAHQIRHR
jgi:hypothetical protein